MRGRFIDTHVLVYFASGDAAKADRAERIVADGGTVRVQVLNKLAHVARREMGLSWGETRALVGEVRGLLEVVKLTVETHESGLALTERHGFPVYDGMIGAAALQAGCDMVWSEDMRDGMVLEEGLRVFDPFRVAG